MTFMISSQDGFLMEVIICNHDEYCDCLPIVLSGGNSVVTYITRYPFLFPFSIRKNLPF
jgi:hypothetical protein